MNKLLFLMILCGVACPAQTSLQTFAKQEKQFSDYAEDFMGFGKGETNSLEHEISTELFTVAIENRDRLYAITALLTIRLGSLCPQDRTLVETVIQEEVSRYRKQIAIDIKQVNLDVRDTKKPGVAAEGLRLQSDLRELQNNLDSIKVSDN